MVNHVRLAQNYESWMNLCVNVRDAMPDGGRLTFKTEVVDGTSLPQDAGTKPERYVRIEVADTGWEWTKAFEAEPSSVLYDKRQG